MTNRSTWLMGAFVVSGIVLLACGGSLMDEPLEAPAGSAAPRASAPLPPVTSVTKLRRDDVDETVRAGLGYFLQHVTVEPVVTEGRFQGFRVVELRPREYWAGVELRPGDIVTGVNGMPIERDIDAYNAFQSLRRAPELRVTFVREGKGREMLLPIIGAPKAVAARADAGRTAPP